VSGHSDRNPRLTNDSRLFLKHVHLTAKYGRNVVAVNQKVGSPILGRI